MKKYDVLVLGAGPAGLSAAYTLKNAGFNVGLYDKNEKPGGLCRSFTIDGFTFDTFAHVNFCKDKYVYSLLEEKNKFLTHSPEAFNYSEGKWIRNPVQNNLIGLDVEERINIIKGFINRNSDLKVQNYYEWLLKQYGDYFTNNYPSKYTRKYWTVEPEKLETKWVEGRMYTPDIYEVLKGAMTKETPNVHYSKEIHYPLNGGYESFFSELINDSFVGKKELVKIDYQKKRAFFCDGDCVEYKDIISTIPLDVLLRSIENPIVSQEILSLTDNLDYTSGYMVSIGLKAKHKSPSLWFYIYDEDILPARVYCPDIKSPNNVPNGCSALQAEIYYSKYKKIDISVEEIKNLTIKQLADMNLYDISDVVVSDIRKEEYANIMFTKEIYSVRDKLHSFLDDKNIYYAGRFGEWDYLWTGQSILSGKNVAEKIIRNMRDKL